MANLVWGDSLARIIRIIAWVGEKEVRNIKAYKILIKKKML